MKLSAQQRRVVEQSTLVGFDARDRPVVEKLVGIPGQLRRWAVLRSGDPADITEPVDTPKERGYVSPPGEVPVVAGRIYASDEWPYVSTLITALEGFGDNASEVFARERGDGTIELIVDGVPFAALRRY